MGKFAKDPAAIAKLSPEQHRVTQFCGTEMPGTGALLHNMEKEGYGAYLNQVGDKS